MPPETPSRTRAMAPIVPAYVPFRGLLDVFVLQHALRNFLHSHREVILRAGFDERRRIVVERAFAELVVVVVDLPGTLRGHDDKRIARVDVLEQIVYTGMDHRSGMVAAGTAI